MNKGVIYKGRKETFVFKNIAFEAINFAVTMVADAVNTAVVGIDLKKVRINAILQQEGEKTVVATGLLEPLHIHSMLRFPQACLRFVGGELGVANIYTRGVVTQVHSAPVKGQTLLPCKVIFDGGIILKGTDTLSIEVSVESDAFAVENDNDSFITIYPEAAITRQLAIPKIIAELVPTDKMTYQRDFEDNVSRISFINVDKAQSLATIPFSRVSFESDKANYDMTAGEFIANARNVNSLDVSNNYFTLCSGVDFDDVKIQIDLVTANVTNARNYVVCSGFMPDPVLVDRHNSRVVKHNTKLNEKLLGRR